MKTLMQARRLGILLAACAASSVSAPHSAASQNEQTQAPPAAYSVGAAYDAGRARLVVFGGYLRGQYFGDTWEWDGRAWARTPHTGPIARNGPALVYDAARRQIVLFGGNTRATGPLGDTWVYDGRAWRQAATNGPSARDTRMAYDSRRQRVVLFGGAAGDQALGDTWEWDGQRWTQVATSGPGPRMLHGLAYDSARGRVVLFGGINGAPPNGTSLSDTWEWDGSHWTRAEANGPDARDHVALSYDPVHRTVVLHGGGSRDKPQETWTYDGRAWTLASTSGPRRFAAELAFDAAGRTLLLYGGFDREPTNELWRWNATDWQRITP